MSGQTTHVTQVEPKLLEMARTPPVHVLDLVQGEKAHRYQLDKAELVIGRGADVELKVESTELSRRHAKFTRKDREYVCEDLDSKNGLFLNGLKVHSAILRDGDVLQMGNLIFIYRERG